MGGGESSLLMGGGESSLLMGGGESSLLMGGGESSLLMGGGESSLLMGGGGSSLLMGGGESSLLMGGGGLSPAVIVLYVVLPALLDSDMAQVSASCMSSGKTCKWITGTFRATVDPFHLKSLSRMWNLRLWPRAPQL